MKARLMSDYADFDVTRRERATDADLIQDLELEALWDVMAAGDPVVRQVVQSAMLSGLDTTEDIRYRQRVLEDCARQPEVTRALYDLAVDAIAGEKAIPHGIFGDRGDALLRRSVDVLTMFIDRLRRLRALADAHAADFRSEGFARFFDQVRRELDEDYFAEMTGHLGALHFRDGVLLSARLGPGNKSVDYTLRTPRPEHRGGLFNHTPLERPTFGFTIADRDEAGFQALGELRDRGLDLVANALDGAATHVLRFFQSLRIDAAFYIGTLNLQRRLLDLGEPVCLPDARDDETVLHARGLYDPGLVLRTNAAVVGNDIDADDTLLVMITGANQGGKSTYLRALGVAHLMMQCGMFVAADAFASTLTAAVYTHYRREEDATMASGKFDEELRRMSVIADEIGPHSLLLCNESFAATNEREGAAIAGDLIRALNDAEIRVVFVTHMYDLAHRFQTDESQHALFLRALRDDDGQRPYRLEPGDPLPTSFGEDLYRRTFESADHQPADHVGQHRGGSS